jgi:hypothetical protein
MKPSSPLYILWLLVLCAGVVACTDREAMQERLAKNADFIDPLLFYLSLVKSCEIFLSQKFVGHWKN